jgi:hypothetical protein
VSRVAVYAGLSLLFILPWLLYVQVYEGATRIFLLGGAFYRGRRQTNGNRIVALAVLCVRGHSSRRLNRVVQTGASSQRRPTRIAAVMLLSLDSRISA